MRDGSRTVVALFMIFVAGTAPTMARAASNHELQGCFGRVYEPSHLSTHPNQKTRKLTLSLGLEAGSSGYAVRFAVERIDRSTAYGIGGCDWEDNKMVDGGLVLRTVRKRKALFCILTVAPGSAEEGGTIALDPSEDRKGITLHLDASLHLRRGLGARKATTTAFGPSDRVFRLERTSEAECTEMNARLKPD